MSTKDSMEWSQYSLDLFEAYRSTTDNVIVQACPGAGKTTNIEHLWALDTQPTVYLVFNKANQEEAQRKLPPKDKSAVLTINSLGHRILLGNYGSVQLDNRKVLELIKGNVRHPYGTSGPLKREREWQLAKVVGQCKQTLLSTEISPEDYQKVLSFYDLESYPGMHDDAQNILEISDGMHTLIDFADQIRLPALYNLDIPHYPTVLGDEVQDWSPIQAKLISKLGADRYVLVGDEHQSIYAFRGAMNDSMTYLRKHFNCLQLPLSITYRCATAIVAQAKQIYPEIEPWELSPCGQVRYSSADAIVPTDYSNTLIVCRSNRPLIDLAYQLLERGIPCHVRGRDIGEGLVNLVKKQDATCVRDLIAKLSQWRDLEMQKALVREDETQIQRIDDKYASLMVLISRCEQADSPSVVVSDINELFSQGRGVCLSTVHKAKGLEAHTCYLLAHNLFEQSTSRARYDWQVVQEKNIEYVAVTRAKRELVYC